MDVDGQRSRFAAELDRLKREGSAVLVRDDGAGHGVCTALQGSEAERRRRVLVRAADAEVLPVPPSGATVVDVTPRDARSASTQGGDAFDPASVDRRVGEAEAIEPVATAVREVVEGIDEAVSPGELRVCLGRLSPYLARQGADAVSDAVESVMGAVKERRGMGHAHLSCPPPDALAAVFDVTVAVRRAPSGLQEERWHLHEADIDTGWIER